MQGNIQYCDIANKNEQVDNSCYSSKHQISSKWFQLCPVGKAELKPSFPCLNDVVQKVSSDTGGLSALESKRAETEYEMISVTETLRNESNWMKSRGMESREPHDNPWTLIQSINPEKHAEWQRFSKTSLPAIYMMQS